MSRTSTITLLTDFGAGSVYVGQMHGVLRRRAPEATVIDLAHDVPPGGVAAAAYLLQRSFDCFPPGSVHVAVIDPGVGSARRILAARAHGHTFLAPDNGLLGPLLDGETEAVVHSVENEELMRERVSRTFHGRDIFAPVAAWLAGGGALEEVGPPVAAEIARPGAVLEDGVIRGRLLLVDRFGNLITNVPKQLLEVLGAPEGLRVSFGGRPVGGLVGTFSDAPRDSLLAYVGSGDHLELAVNGGRASDVLGDDTGAEVRVERSPA
ncbi:MAG: SAM-dependent chlorinase/fluorinase [Planctomycetota bacterium]|nr:SAM-dependent chlorinase/fluorinase [Planctomycetota bacterium]